MDNRSTTVQYPRRRLGASNRKDIHPQIRARTNKQTSKQVGGNNNQASKQTNHRLGASNRNYTHPKIRAIPNKQTQARPTSENSSLPRRRTSALNHPQARARSTTKNNYSYWT